MQSNPALSKLVLPWILGSVAVFAILCLIRLMVGDDMVPMAIALSAGVIIILVLMAGFNELKKRL
jgi:hypothetical protein